MASNFREGGSGLTLGGSVVSYNLKRLGQVDDFPHGLVTSGVEAMTLLREEGGFADRAHYSETELHP